jgi:serine kinase of HPr protein (carbohydrate metabolism regulator)
MTETTPDRVQIHASCVALSGVAVLLRGAPGAGKSDLALRLVDQGGMLVADDLCEIRREGGRLLADLPSAVEPRFRGRIELRGIGFLTLPYAGATPLSLVADLSSVAGERDALGEAVYLGIALPLVVLDPFRASAAARLRLLAKVGAETIMRAP